MVPLNTWRRYECNCTYHLYSLPDRNSTCNWRFPKDLLALWSHTLQAPRQSLPPEWIWQDPHTMVQGRARRILLPLQSWLGMMLRKTTSSPDMSFWVSFSSLVEPVPGVSASWVPVVGPGAAPSCCSSLSNLQAAFCRTHGRVCASQRAFDATSKRRQLIAGVIPQPAAFCRLPVLVESR